MYLWRNPLFADLFGMEYFPKEYLAQSNLYGIEGLQRALEFILKVSRRGEENDQ